jgi:hypothetical protein
MRALEAPESKKDEPVDQTVWESVVTERKGEEKASESSIIENQAAKSSEGPQVTKNKTADARTLANQARKEKARISRENKKHKQEMATKKRAETIARKKANTAAFFREIEQGAIEAEKQSALKAKEALHKEPEKTAPASQVVQEALPNAVQRALSLGDGNESQGPSLLSLQGAPARPAEIETMAESSIGMKPGADEFLALSPTTS